MHIPACDGLLLHFLLWTGELFGMMCQVPDMGLRHAKSYGISGYSE